MKLSQGIAMNKYFGVLLISIFLFGCGGSGTDQSESHSIIDPSENDSPLNETEDGDINNSEQEETNDPTKEDDSSNSEETNEEETNTPVNTNLENLQNNTAMDLGEFFCENHPEGEGESAATCSFSVTDYSGMVYDEHHHQMLMFGGGHAATMTDDVYKFDLNTLTWSGSYQPTSCPDMAVENYIEETASWTATGHPVSRHTYDMMVVTNEAELVLLAPGGTTGGMLCAQGDIGSSSSAGLAHFQPDTNEWILSDAELPWGKLAASELDPTTGWAIIVTDFYFYVFDLNTKTIVDIFSHGQAVSYAKNMVYYPPTDKMYYILDGNNIFELTLDRENIQNSSFVLLDDVQGDIPDLRETGFAYDSANQVIGGAVKNGGFYTFNPQNQTWSQHIMNVAESSESPSSMLFHVLDYDPINNVFIFIDENRHTYAYRY